MSILESINSPADLRALPPEQLRTVADEIRNYILETMSRVGGHTGASLGAVELAVALHYAFDTPRDRLVWDVGHQAYAHKILTGRRELLPTVKQYGGISGVLRPDESEDDTVGAGHAPPRPRPRPLGGGRSRPTGAGKPPPPSPSSAPRP